MSDKNNSDTPAVGANETIDAEGDQGLFLRLQEAQQRSLDNMSDRIESSVDKLANVLSQFISGAAGQKRPSKTNSAGTACKIARKNVQEEAPNLAPSLEGDSDNPVSDSEPEQDADNVSIPDHSSIDQGIAELLQTPDEDPQGENSSVQILDEIEEDFDLASKKGDEIDPKLAKIINKLFTEKLPDDKVREKIKNLLVPSNCPSVAVPRCNQEIFTENLTQSYRSQENSLQKIQNQLTKVTAAVANNCDKLLAYKTDNIPKEDVKPLISNACDALALLGHAMQDLTQYRRDNIRLKLPYRYQGLASNVPAGSTLLFGDELSKRIQNMTSTNNVLKKANMVKSPRPSSSYSHPRASKNKFTPHRSLANGKKGYHKRQGSQNQHNKSQWHEKN